MNDLIIRNASLAGKETVDIAVTHGCIADISPSLAGSAQQEITAGGLHVFPGFIDAHVHFNEPGREHWEGLASGSHALAAGGGTCFFDMPLNSDPPVLNAERFEEKRRIAEQKSILDFALWGGLCPGHAEAIDEMAEAGAIGFKAFLCPSGIEEFPATDAATLREGLLRAKQWNLPVAVHAEAPEFLDRQAGNMHGRSLRDFFASRPKEAEVASIKMACEMAGETGGQLHVVHVSCTEGLAEIAAARRAGVNVTAETCPHYLLFDAGQAEKIGARAKCAPPLRAPADKEALWKALLAGDIDTIGSDHSPAPPDMKTGDDFFAIWGGIAGCQHAWPAFLGALHDRAPGQMHFGASLGSSRVATRFHLPQKGNLTVGSDADFTLVRFQSASPVRAEDLLYRHRMSLYEGFSPSSEIVMVVRRGEIIVKEGAVSPSVSPGRFLRPAA